MPKDNSTTLWAVVRNLRACGCDAIVAEQQSGMPIQHGDVLEEALASSKHKRERDPERDLAE